MSLTYRGGTTGCRNSARVTYDPAAEPLDDGDTTIRLDPNAWIIIRVLVESADDLAQARSLQRQFSVRPAADHPHVRTKSAGRAAKIAEAGAAFFTELSVMSQWRVLRHGIQPCHPTHRSY